MSADRVTLGTATPGGGFPVYGEAVARTINECDPSLDVKTQHTRGSTENVPLLVAGELDLALVQGEVAPRSPERRRAGRRSPDPRRDVRNPGDVCRPRGLSPSDDR